MLTHAPQSKMTLPRTEKNKQHKKLPFRVGKQQNVT